MIIITRNTLVLLALITLVLLLVTSRMHCAQIAEQKPTFKQKASLKYDQAKQKAGEVKQSASEIWDDFVRLVTGGQRDEKPNLTTLVPSAASTTKTAPTTKPKAIAIKSSTGTVGKKQQNLGTVDKKSGQVLDNAGDFLDTARKLREQEEKRSKSWF